MTAAELAHQLRSRKLSALEVAEAYLDRIASLDARFGAFLRVDREGALEQAEIAQKRLDQGLDGPLTGVPIALKDNLCTQGLETTCASKILTGYVPPYDAEVVARCRDAGMVILGKTNMDEFAMGTSTEHSAYFPSRNPWDTDRSPGGSSGGSAAAVAADLAPLALGSDTGGSIRQPAALCGAVGFKPSYGRVSRYGLIAFASSLDQVGPIAHTVEDAALLAQVISGVDPRDNTTLDLPSIAPPTGSSPGGSPGPVSLKGVKVGIPRELFGEAIHPGVRREIEAAMEAMKHAGADLREVSLPSIRYGVTTYYIIAPAEASSNLARFDGIRYGARREGPGHVGVVERTRAEGFGHEVKARIMIGTYALSAGSYDLFYRRALQVRALMTREFNDAFAEVDLLLSPTSPVTAFKLGDLKSDPLALKLLDACTIPANLGGFPAISMNCGFDQGLPVGLQLMAPALQDERLLSIARTVEDLLPNARRRPAV